MEKEMNQLFELIKNMDLPSFRKTQDTIHNIEWLGRNIGIRNSDHPNFNQALEVIKSILVGEK